MSDTNMNADNTMLRVGSELQMGKYIINRYLSSGGFGNTYLATNTTFDEQVAIKEFFIKDINYRQTDTQTVCLNNTLQKPVFQAQMRKFKTEARRLRSLHSAHIVSVSDLFDENGTTYYVMDYIDGESLRDMVKKQGSLKEKDVISFLSQTLDALEEVHHQMMFHLDIKPANIMVDKKGRVCLIDFGASKQQKSDGGATSMSAICYSPGYAPIEQKDQEISNFGPWTDLYALGATLYNALTGETPPSTSKISDFGVDAFQFPTTVSENMKSLIVWMMKGRRLERPQSVSDVREFIAKNDMLSLLSEGVKDKDEDEGDKTILPSSEDHKRIIINNIVNNLVTIGHGKLAFGSVPRHDGFASSNYIFELDDFRICKFAVTQEEWQCIMGSNPSEYKGQNLPVTNVNWMDCQMFVDQLNQLTSHKYGFRLPYEAEWEYAAIGGEKHQGYKFAGGDNLEDVAWTKVNSAGTPHPVGKKVANELGLYDLTGNVWEWCFDEYSDSESGQSGNKYKDRAYRGAAFDSKENDCVVTQRRTGEPEKKTCGIGFRLAASIDGKQTVAPRLIKDTDATQLYEVPVTHVTQKAEAKPTEPTYQESPEQSSVPVSQQPHEEATSFVARQSYEQPSIHVTKKEEDAATSLVTGKNDDASTSLVTGKNGDASTSLVTGKNDDSSVETPEPSDVEKTGTAKKGNIKMWAIIGASVILLGIIGFVFSNRSSTPTTGDQPTVELQETSKPATVSDKEFENNILGKYIYSGPVDDNGLPNGEGYAKFIKNGKPDGRSYQGMFVHGVFESEKSVYQMENGDNYEGSFKNNYFHEGTYTRALTKDYFKGSYIKGLPSKGAWYNQNNEIIQEVN